MASASPAGGEGRAQLRPLSEGGENLRATPAPSSSPPPPARWQGCGGPRAHLRAGAEARPRPPRGAARQMRSPGRRRRALTVPLAAPSMPPQEEPPRFAALPPVPPHRPRGRRELLRALECVLLGDGAVGKTSLALSYSTNGFPARYVPTALDRFSAVVLVDGAPVRLQLCDTAGQDEFDVLRQVCYPKADVVLLCFSVVAPTSFHNISEKWYPEIRRHCPSTPVLLVGTQSDLRQDVKVLIALARRREKPVPPAAAGALSAKLGLVGYVECSALTQHNLKELFDTAIAVGLRQAEPPGPRAHRSSAGRLRTLSKAWWRKCVCAR